MKVRARSKPRREAGSKGGNILRHDPSRTFLLRRSFAAKLRRQFARLKGSIVKLVAVEDAFGLKERAVVGNVSSTRKEFHVSLPRRDLPVDGNLRIISVPDIRQRDHYSCGAAASMAVGRHFGVGPATLEAWKKLLGTDVEESTHPGAIVEVLSDLGLSVEAKEGMTVEDLRRLTSRGAPVICPVQDYGPFVPKKARFDYGHYLTVIGVGSGFVFCQDSSEDNVIADSGSAQEPGRVMISEVDWERIWHDEDAKGRKYVRYGIAVSSNPLIFVLDRPSGVPADATFSEEYPGGPNCWTDADGWSFLCWSPDFVETQKHEPEIIPVPAVNVAPHERTVGMDFDGTITDDALHADDLSKVEPREGVRDAIKRMRDAGLKVVIYSGNEDPPAVKAWLKAHDIPFDGYRKKMKAGAYVDDKSIHATEDKDWEEDILPEVLEQVFGEARQPIGPADGWQELRDMADGAEEELRQILSRFGFPMVEYKDLSLGDLELKLLGNAFCPTGEGGGVDPSCSPSGGVGQDWNLKTTDDGINGTGTIDEHTKISYLSISKYNSVTPAEVDLKHEMEAVRASVSETQAFWGSDSSDARAIRRADGLSSEANDPKSFKASVNMIMTGDKSNAGAGSGGPGSAKVFWVPYSLPDRDEKLKGYTDGLGVDPMYVLSHELHHAYGHGSEFDNSSDVAAVAAHLKTDMRFGNPKAVKYWVYSKVAVLDYDVDKSGKLGSRANLAGRSLRYLNDKYPEQLKKAAIGNVVDNEEQWSKLVKKFNGIGKKKVVDNALVSNASGGIVILAGVKGEDRATEKVKADYDGDWSWLLDVVRASVVLDSMSDLREASEKLLGWVEEAGGSLARLPKDRFKEPYGNGYRDLLVNYRLSSGFIVEVLFNLKPMFLAREREHQNYDVVRAIRAAMEHEGREEMTPGEAEAVRRIKEGSKLLYAKAWEECKRRDGVLNIFCPTGEGGGVDPSCSPGGIKIGGHKGTVEAVGSYVERDMNRLKKEHPVAWQKLTEGQGVHVVLEQGTYTHGTSAMGFHRSGEVHVGTMEQQVEEGGLRYGKGNVSGKSIVGTVRHELGHELHSRVSPAEKAEWSNVYSSINPAGISVRASRNQSEGFAESFLAYTHRSYQSGQLPRPVEDYMQKVAGKKFVSNTLSANIRWKFNTTSEQVEAFKAWLKQQVQTQIRGQTQDQLWQQYILDGYKKGAGRAFDDATASEKALSEASGEPLDFFAGTKERFLRDSFAHPVSIDRVKQLAGRVFSELEGMTATMSTRMSRVLLDGLVQGQGLRDVARDLAREIDISRERALLISRTEIIRAHAEGALDGFERLGVEDVGVMVEFSDSEDDLVCPDCDELDGVVLTIDEMRGVIPVHPGCRCSPIPANVGEDDDGQKRSRTSILSAFENAGTEPGAPVSRDRPKSVLNVGSGFRYPWSNGKG